MSSFAGQGFNQQHSFENPQPLARLMIQECPALIQE
jgi:hypothetical protein